MTNFTNYIFMVIGVFTVLIAMILIFIDKLKGEDIYFNMDVKEQEIKKVIEDADEIIAEMNYTSEAVVKEIEEKLSSIRQNIYVQQGVQEYRPQRDMYIAQKPMRVNIPQEIEEAEEIINIAPPKPKQKPPKNHMSEKQRTILEYASQGMTTMEIAKRMNIGQGEVALILSIKNEVIEDEQI